MSVRKLTPTESEDLTIRRIEAGAVGRNAVVCKCGRVVGHSPNTPQFQDNVFVIPSCDWCELRLEDE